MVVVVVVVTIVVCVAGAYENCPSISSAVGSSTFLLWILFPYSSDVTLVGTEKGDVAKAFVVGVEVPGFKKASTRDEGASKTSGLCRGGSIPMRASRCSEWPHTKLTRWLCWSACSSRKCRPTRT